MEALPGLRIREELPKAGDPNKDPYDLKMRSDGLYMEVTQGSDNGLAGGLRAHTGHLWVTN